MNEPTPEQVRSWMEENDWTVEDVASALGYHFNTVYNFLSGKTVYHSTVMGFARLVQGSIPKIKPRTG